VKRFSVMIVTAVLLVGCQTAPGSPGRALLSAQELQEIKGIDFCARVGAVRAMSEFWRDNGIPLRSSLDPEFLAAVATSQFEQNAMLDVVQMAYLSSAWSDARDSLVRDCVSSKRVMVETTYKTTKYSIQEAISK
jgi:hypothetical protein